MLSATIFGTTVGVKMGCILSVAMLSKMTDVTGVGRLFCIRLLLFTREMWQHSDFIAVITMEHWFTVSLENAVFEL
jgi:hypothetical protein